MTCQRCRSENDKRAEKDGVFRPVRCDIDGICGQPGEPGTKGALDPDNIALAEFWMRYKALGSWVMEPLGQELFFTSDPEFNELNINLMYELELENRALRQQYTTTDETTGQVMTRRLIWDDP